MRNVLLIPLFGLSCLGARSQSLGGSTVYNFLKLSNTPQLTGLGGINISNQSSDVGLTFNNPALLRASMHSEASFVFNSFYAGIRNLNLVTAYHREKWQTTFAFGINYFSYGSIPETDFTGNVLGSFRPVDYVVQVSAARQYKERWHYGATLKFIHSGYGNYSSSGLALDAGLTYTDTANLVQVALLMKNMGAQISTYTGAGADDLPFDLQLGISKKLARAPLQFSLTVHQLHRFNIRYDDTAFNNENGFGQNANGKKYIFDKFFRHIVLAVQLFISDKVEISTAYNHLRRKELNIGNAGNGLNGFSLGVGVLLKKFQLRYARSYYQNNSGYNQFGLNIRLSDYFGRGQHTGVQH